MKTHHVALKVLDLAKCEKFYRENLELEILQHHYDESENLRAVWLDLEGTILMLERFESSEALPEKPEHSGWHLLALQISLKDREKFKQKLIAAGITITQESPYSLYFSDPEGNRLALSHYPDSISSEISSAGAECVTAPTEI